MNNPDLRRLAQTDPQTLFFARRSSYKSGKVVVVVDEGADRRFEIAL